MTLEEIIEPLNTWAGEEDMCSVQINSDGVCILMLGCSITEHLTVEQFADWCKRQN